VIQRIDVQPNHVGRLGLEVRIVRLHVALEPMRLQPGALPRFGHEVVMNLEPAAQLPRTPVRAAIRRRLPGQLQDTRFHRGRQDRRRLAAVARPQALQTVGQESAPPPIDVVAVAGHRRFNRRIRVAVGEHQNHARAARILRSNLETANASFQFRSLIGRQSQRHMGPESASTASVSTSHYSAKSRHRHGKVLEDWGIFDARSTRQPRGC